MKLLNDNETQVDTLLNSMDKGESLPVIASKLSNATYVSGQERTSRGAIGDWCNNLFFDAKSLGWKHLGEPQSELCWCKKYNFDELRGFRQKEIEGKTVVFLDGQTIHNKIVEVRPSQKFKSFAIVDWAGRYYLILVGLDEDGVWRMWVGDLGSRTLTQRGANSIVVDNWYFKNKRTFDYNMKKCNQTLGGFFANEYLLFNKNSKSKTFNFPLGGLL